jgi:hypothetical protein
MALLEAAYPLTTDTLLTQPKKAVAKYPSTAQIVSMNEVFDIHQNWLRE